MKIGYARISTKQQKLSLQIDALKKEGCELIYREVMTGSKKERPQLQKMIEHLRTGDTVVIWKLDRLARSLRDLISLVKQFEAKGVGLHSLNDHIDTTTPTGRFMFHVFGALSEFESDIIRERTKAGLAAARARGRVGGRPKGLSQKAKITARAAESLYNEQILSTQQICEQLSISRGTLYRYLKHRGVQIGGRSRTPPGRY